MADIDRLPVGIIDIISNSVILRQLAPYIPLKSILNLSATSKTLRDIIISQPEPWRRLDLSGVKAAIIDSIPIDVGGISWRAERMDEALTEDDFYSGPLRGIFSKLQRRNILRNVQTLILDGLSVPADLVSQIVTEDRFNVKILSIREAKNLNQSKLQQVLRYIVRPTRAEGTPKLKALYFFGPKGSRRTTIYHQQRRPIRAGITASEGAQIGAEWNQRSTTALNSSLLDDELRWYGCTGRAMTRPLSDWPETLRACKDVIAFDAVLCRGPRHDITKVDSRAFLQPSIATVALGSKGCEDCGSCPEGAAVWGVSQEHALPLLTPPPLHSSTVKAAQMPSLIGVRMYPNLILRCEDCLRTRWCERCNRWWCETCYEEPTSRIHLRTELQQLELRDQVRNEGWESITRHVYEGEAPQVKVYSKLCTEHCLVSEMMSGAGSNGMWG